MSASVVAPREASEVAAAVRAAAESGTGLRVRGAGTWLDAGHPVRARTVLDLSALTGVREYTPGDLTIAVGAGTTLAELDAATRAHGQWCPLLPWGDDRGTVGATVATATAGPCAASLGRPRDLVIGLECVDGLGRLIRAGGRVVKNVAGFDLVRAMTGQWGTLGVITAVNLRLRARPAVDLTLAVRPHATGAPDAPPAPDASRAADAMHAFVRGPYAPLAAAPLTDDLARRLGLRADSRWLVRLGGNAAFVAASRAALANVGDVVEADGTTWSRYRMEAAPPARAAHWRWDALSRRLKATFDPHGVLNPGLLGEPA